jgi:hypothetical protein
MSQCQALIQQGDKKGQQCNRPIPNGLTEEIYCSKHKRQAIMDKAEKEQIRYCDIARGCYTILEDHQVKCTYCLHKARITDRKRNDKKRQDPNLCLDCGGSFTNPQVLRAKGKHDKDLRRCVPCYEKLLKYESQRTVRERNYKAEAFTNKHVIWNHYVKGAQKRNINFALSKTRFNELILLPCFYCNYKKDGEVNGVDRLNNNSGYQEDNVVPCCETCNIMKGSQHPQEFVDKLYSVYMFHRTATPISEDLIEKWKTTYVSKTPAVYKTYAKNANTRNIKFTLSEQDFEEIVVQPCYLCGLRSITGSGIDRFNNAIGYLKENCRPCCGHCNLLKKDQRFEDLIRCAEQISLKYIELSAFLETKQISVRASKVEARVKVENPQVEEVIALQYKPLNEVIVPREVPEEIKMILQKKEEIFIPKQWKTKQIYEAIQSDQAHLYRQFCEENNELTDTWPLVWQTFIEQTKDKSQEDAETIIKAFVENLRRLRHNQLCAKDVVAREDREQWPATTVVKAFLEGKLDKFKAYSEAHTNENPEDPKWIKRWSSFMKSLEENRGDEAIMKDLCSKFMTAQRTKKYRAKK